MMWLIIFSIIGWTGLNVNIPPSVNSQVAITGNRTFFAVNSNDSVYVYSYHSNQEKFLYSFKDTTGVISISAFDTTLLLCHVLEDSLLELVRIKDTILDTNYTIHSPAKCTSLKLYNDGMLHPYSFPIWYITCKSDEGIFMTHSTDFANSFYTFDTVTTLQTKSFDFTTSVNASGDRLHFIFVTMDSTLYLLNGGYPSNFNSSPIKIDSMLPDTPHISISSKGDTLFIAYERISSLTFPDRDIYYATYHFEGNDEPTLYSVSATTNEETNPLSVIELNQSADTIHLFFINQTGPSEINEAIFPTPYTTFTKSIIFTGNIQTMHTSNWYSRIALIITLQDSSTVLLTNYTVSVKEPALNIRYHSHKNHGTYSIDGRKLRKIPHRGLIIKDGKKIIEIR